MTHTIQSYLARATQKASEDLLTALSRLPEDKRGWSPQGGARTALDQIAECAILNGGMADLIQTKKWPENFDMGGFFQRKAELAQNESAAIALLQENAAKAAAAISATVDEDLDVEIQTAFGAMTMLRLLGMPDWNMSYHAGQINYIASMIGCL